MIQQRINQLRVELLESKLDGLLVSNFFNIVYLTGFKTLTENEREGWAIVTHSNVYLFSDGRYQYQKSDSSDRKQIANLKYFTISPKMGLTQYLQEITKKEKLIRLGYEGDDLRVGEFRRLEENITTIHWIETDKMIIRLREIKDSEEIEKIKKACQIADQCLTAVIKNIKVGNSEFEIAWRIESWLREKGYQPAFTPVIAIDSNAAVPHYDYRQGFGKVRKNSLILIDFGVKYKNYCSDITRIFFKNKPTGQQMNIYQKLVDIQKKAVEQLGKNNHLSEIDSYCRSLMVNSRLPELPHSTGHGVGLEVHEYPKVSQTSKDMLKPNQVFTIEPGVYFPGKWGMRIEDTICISQDRKPNILTQFSKSLLIV